MRRMIMLAALVLAPLAASGQDLYTITSQTRTVTASAACAPGGCTPQSNTATAPDASSWTASVSASAPPTTAFGTASQTSNVLPDTLSGTMSSNSFSGGGGNASSQANLLIIFTPLQRLRFTFSAIGQAPFIGQPGASFSLTGFFDGAPSNIAPMYATGVLLPGASYTFRALVGTNGLGELLGGSYSLVFTPAAPPAPIFAGPIARLTSCHRYFQLGASSWLAAEDRALLLQAHLVTINDAAEQAWLQSTFAGVGPAEKWIGMRTLASNATFRWASRQSPAYTHWAPGRPAYDPPVPFQYFGYYPANGLWSNASEGFVAGGIVEYEGCRCDWDYDGRRTSNDFFSFLTDFFSSGADINCSGSTTSADFFEFLTCFLAADC